MGSLSSRRHHVKRRRVSMRKWRSSIICRRKLESPLCTLSRVREAQDYSPPTSIIGTYAVICPRQPSFRSIFFNISACTQVQHGIARKRCWIPRGATFPKSLACQNTESELNSMSSQFDRSACEMKVNSCNCQDRCQSSCFLQTS